MNIRAPAKINLRLRVLGKRKDGYHLIDTIMIPVSLYDELRITKPGKMGIKRDAHVRVTCDDPLVPEGEKNLAYRAAVLLKNKSGIEEAIHVACSQGQEHDQERQRSDPTHTPAGRRWCLRGCHLVDPLMVRILGRSVRKRAGPRSYETGDRIMQAKAIAVFTRIANLRLRTSEDGQDLLEYGLLGALIAADRPPRRRRVSNATARP